MATSTLTIQIDDNLKEKGEAVFSRFGLNFTEALNLFVRKSVEEDKIPFESEDVFDLDGPYTEEEEALLYSPENVTEILERVKRLDAGEGITFEWDEFKAMSKELLDSPKIESPTLERVRERHLQQTKKAF